MFSPFIRASGALIRPDLRHVWNDAFLEASFGPFLPAATADAAPFAAFRDAGDAFVVSVEAPGFAEADLKVEVDRGVVTIVGARALAVPEGYRAQVRERNELSITRRYPLPGPVNGEEIVATLREGVLTVTLPKAPERKPVPIHVTAN